MKKFKEFINESNLHVFDIDDTLFHTSAKIKVMKGKKHVGSLSSSEYNNHKLPKGHTYDYSEFRSAHKFNTESKPVHKMLHKLRSVHAKAKTNPNNKVIMNTAREDFDDKDKFLDTFRKHKVDIDNIHVHRAGNISRDKGISIGHAKTSVIDDHLKSGKYHTVHLYDDNETNLSHFTKLKEKHPNIKFKAHHVQPDGNIMKHKE